MSMIDDLKRKAADYLEDVGKKKDELIEKADIFKREYNENRRRKMEDWVYKKEAELNELDKKLKKREELIRQNELKLKQKFFVRFIGVAAGFSVIGLFLLVAFIATTETRKSSFSTQAGNTETILEPSKSSEPYTPREEAAYGIYREIDPTTTGFDVGNYCLDKEKKGGITFEECLAVAAAKLMSKQ